MTKPKKALKIAKKAVLAKRPRTLRAPTPEEVARDVNHPIERLDRARRETNQERAKFDRVHRMLEDATHEGAHAMNVLLPLMTPVVQQDMVGSEVVFLVALSDKTAQLIRTLAGLGIHGATPVKVIESFIYEGLRARLQS